MWGSSGTGKPHLGKTHAGMVLLYNQLVTGGAMWARRPTARPAASPPLLIPKISFKHFGDGWRGADEGPDWPHLDPPTLPMALGLYLGSDLAAGGRCCLGLSLACPHEGGGVSDTHTHTPTPPPAITHELCLLLGHPGTVPVLIGSLPFCPTQLQACL